MAEGNFATTPEEKVLYNEDLLAIILRNADAETVNAAMFVNSLWNKVVEKNVKKLKRVPVFKVIVERELNRDGNGVFPALAHQHKPTDLIGYLKFAQTYATLHIEGAYILNSYADLFEKHYSPLIYIKGPGVNSHLKLTGRDLRTLAEATGAKPLTFLNFLDFELEFSTQDFNYFVTRSRFSQFPNICLPVIPFSETEFKSIMSTLDNNYESSVAVAVHKYTVKRETSQIDFYLSGFTNTQNA
ncbi:unnamed protein product [Caenorhabditis auriculariae]|uniref:Uncharacterized protein n=1 Tax=Caenorhabditis auriculariae TaxID=2777116 RepID=A0A8S1GZH6_9PELO|nr:unnamed protein product [Caenorhabditis auriculariae]